MNFHKTIGYLAALLLVLGLLECQIVLRKVCSLTIPAPHLSVSISPSTAVSGYGCGKVRL